MLEDGVQTGFIYGKTGKMEAAIYFSAASYQTSGLFLWLRSFFRSLFFLREHRASIYRLAIHGRRIASLILWAPDVMGCSAPLSIGLESQSQRRWMFDTKYQVRGDTFLFFSCLSFFSSLTLALLL